MTTQGLRRGIGALATVVVVGLVATGCSNSRSHAAGTATTAPELTGNPPAATFRTVGSVGQVHVSGATAGARLGLYGRSGRAVDTGVTDSQGALIFRDVEPAEGYRVATLERPVTASPTVTVQSIESSLPPQAFYDDQHLAPGFGYITTRDGTTLSTSVYLPGPADKGPYPTVVEYSGYDPSRPGTNLLEENADALKPIVGDDPNKLCGIVSFACNAPAQPSSLLALAMGYAVVAVNIRGTGCSGGAYDFFEPLQLTDGYDVVETAAAQPWVKGHKVGMVGLSYPGISQLFVAQMQPPSLAAIAPLSVIEDAVRSTLAPGGILNSGFALSWAKEVGDKAKPYGQGWEKARVDAGDTTCAANQEMRGQNVDTVKLAMSHRYYPPEIADRLNPSLFVQKIKVPVFLSGSYQDEQTGGRFPLPFDKSTNAPVVHFTATNGTHADGYAPFNLTEWKTFLDLYVADQITPIPGVVTAFAPIIMKKIFDTAVDLPPQRFLDAPSVEAARAQYQAEAPIRLLFESGAGKPSAPGAPVATVDVRTTAWPPPGTKPESLWLGADGTMSPTQPSAGSGKGDAASRFLVDPALAKQTTFSGDTGDIFHALPDYDWQQEPKGSAAVFVSEPLPQDQVFVGSASADLWIRTPVKDADVGVTLSEVRPDGKETFIQAGLLRATFRKVAAGSTDLLPRHTGYRSDSLPLTPNKWTELRIEIFPFGQIVRAGSRLRLSVHTPGGDRPRWSYIIDRQPKGTWIDVGHSAEHPSKVVLPLSPDVLAGVPYPKDLPPCPGLRGQPCRAFEAYTNTPTPNG